MTDSCMMAGCGQEVVGSGLCERHHCQAYPDERGMNVIRDHVARENAFHPMSTEFARRRHKRQLVLDRLMETAHPDPPADVTPFQ